MFVNIKKLEEQPEGTVSIARNNAAITLCISTSITKKMFPDRVDVLWDKQTKQLAIAPGKDYKIIYKTGTTAIAFGHLLDVIPITRAVRCTFKRTKVDGKLALVIDVPKFNSATTAATAEKNRLKHAKKVAKQLIKHHKHVINGG